GTTANIDLTWSDTTDKVAVATYRVVNMYPFDPGSVYNGRGTTPTASTDVEHGGILIAAYAGRLGGVSVTLSNVTTDSNGLITGGNLRYAFGHYDVTADCAAYTVLATLGSSDSGHLALSSWRTTPPGGSPWQPSDEGSLRMW